MSSTPPDSPNTPPPPSLTRAEFAAAVRKFNRNAVSYLLVATLGILALMAVLSVILEMLNEHGVLRDSARGILVIPLLFAYVIGAICLSDWLMRRSRFRCPACQNSLLYGAQLILVTGRCAKCAHPVFADEGRTAEPRTESRERGLVSQADVKAAEVAARRKAIRPTLKWAVSGAVLLGIGAATYAILQPVIESSLGELWAPFLQPALLAPGLAVGFWTIAVWTRHTRHPFGHCPSCGEGLLKSALQTGNCSSCGQRAVSDPFPGMETGNDNATSSGTGWTIAEFHALANGREDSLVKAFLLPLGLTMTGVILCRLFESSKLVLIYTRIAMPFAIIWMCWFMYKEHRRLQCPVCKGELSASGLVISSRRCYHCGSVVLRDSPRAS